MDKLTAEIIQNQMIGQTSGHMAAIPNTPILYSLFETYCQSIGISNNNFNENFKTFISDLNEALQKK